MNITIKDHLWNIIFVEPYSDILRVDEELYSLGATDKINQTIYITSNLPPKKEKMVLTHQLVHAFCYEYNILISGGSEEYFADIIAALNETFNHTLALVYSLI